MPQSDVELLRGAVRRQRGAGGHGDRNLVAQHLLWVIFGPDAMGAPDDQRDDRHLRLQGDPGRPGLKLPEFETAADGGLGMHPDQFALTQPLYRDCESVVALPRVPRGATGMVAVG